MKRLVLLFILVVIGVGLYLMIRRAVPYDDRPELLNAEISIDSLWSIGPATAIYDKSSQKYYWLKLYTSLESNLLDSIKSKHARIRYMKFLSGPLENRIFWMEVDSVVIIDQIVERE